MVRPATPSRSARAMAVTMMSSRLRGRRGTAAASLGTGRGVDAQDSAAAGSEGHNTSGPNTDQSMTRSEEQLHVGTERQETGRARLRKHIVAQRKTVTVPVQREEVRLER